MRFRELFQSTIDQIQATKAAFRRALRHGDLQEPTRHPGSKRPKRLVKIERVRKRKAAKAARKHNRRYAKSRLKRQGRTTRKRRKK